MKILMLSLLLIMMAQPQAYACKNCSTSDACVNPSTLVPNGCSLSAVVLSERITEIGDLFSLREEVRELENGYAFRFPGEETELATRLATWIIAERQCCSFLEFGLSFAAEQGPIWLTVNGSQEAKAFVAAMIDAQ
jgi:hypothetical protein